MVKSAGLLMYRHAGDQLEYFLVHPGGPVFTKKDDGYWGIPKGIPENGEDLQIAAIREFEEETGIKPFGRYIPLGSVIQKNNKEVFAWAFEGAEGDLPKIVSNTFEFEWPYKSGKYQHYPEIDEGRYFRREEALKKIYSPQSAFIHKLDKILNINNPEEL